MDRSMHPEDIALRRLVENAPLPDGGPPSVVDRTRTADRSSVRQHVSPNGQLPGDPHVPLPRASEELQQEHDMLVAAAPAKLRPALAPYIPTPEGLNTAAALFHRQGGRELLAALCDVDTARRENAEDAITSALLIQQFTTTQALQLELNAGLSAGLTFGGDGDTNTLGALLKMVDMTTARTMSLVRLRRTLRSPGNLSLVLQGQNQQVNLNATSPDAQPDR